MAPLIEHIKRQHRLVLFIDDSGQQRVDIMHHDTVDWSFSFDTEIKLNEFVTVLEQEMSMVGHTIDYR